MAETTAWRPAEGGLALSVRLTPRAHDDRLDGLVIDSAGKPALAARVRAIPEAGKANAALLGLLGRELGVSRSALAIAQGKSARLKTIRIAGDYHDLAKRLAVLAAEAS